MIELRGPLIDKVSKLSANGDLHNFDIPLFGKPLEIILKIVLHQLVMVTNQENSFTGLELQRMELKSMLLRIFYSSFIQT